MSKQKVVVITGDQSGIGKCVKESFEKNGAIVCGIDIQEGSFYHGDIADEKVLEAFVSKVITHYQKVDIIINNALPVMKGIDDCTYEEFQHALSVGVTAPFYLVKLLKPHLSEGASIVNISSTRAMMSQAQTESYSAAKGGIHALTHALAVSLSGIARVNAISPGWIDTTNTIYTGANAYQHPAGRVGKPEDIAEMVKFLCSEEAAFITGENITIDGGMSKLMIYHNDQGWSLQ
ncbi:SDR family oxidoreductase [Macrococcoides caseolyticum]|uniref:SDR family NAD(P)-dependent oxidoreductase n=3 Tax=Macrococcoides caseolyticum TaxID=69966 RepID=B9EBZ1_MACCJ|nr:SDR family oxidoreductase [Macrococcus caseolyticus]ARQ04516.1 3-oxoacyl-[acyl-carrier-protein] reductase FabG [Macrococcus caseolyticus]PKD97480.1 short-chain dehydrogenase [Macrococcus caseolyticus]PKE07529.1 short-chain dehydrogenase [Macrococcus caseolyticus]PKE17209.1 short-chain dehydrogenase [Macrococcus caseolyticus]PKE20232.1 short-chain dehydrogenase [Macrococcus caseolyticus]